MNLLCHQCAVAIWNSILNVYPLNDDYSFLIQFTLNFLDENGTKYVDDYDDFKM